MRADETLRRRLNAATTDTTERIVLEEPPAGRGTPEATSRLGAPKASPGLWNHDAVPALGYLITGTSLALLGQLVTDQAAFHPATQLIAWTKYLATFVLSLAVQLLSGSAAGKRTGANEGPADPATSRKAALLTLVIGLLDTTAYGLNCLGFAICGSALSMVVFAACGQVFTAVVRRVLLGKSMTPGQVMGVLLVALGLAVRSLGAAQWAAGSATPGASLTYGVGLVALSALGYSLLGCLYEWLSALRGPAMSHAQVATTTSLIGLIATTAFQVVYTWPRRQELVVDMMARRGLTWWPVVRLYGVFGALFTVHGLVQGVVLQRSGAQSVGIVSALRAAAVAVASSALFCRPGGPVQQCLTPSSAASAAIVTGGALLWTLAGPSRKSMPLQTVTAKGGE